LADIIPLDDKIEVAREKKAAVRRQQKGVIVRRVLQCTGCSLKCEKCGSQIEAGAVVTSERCPHSRFPYKFCEACEDEYQDYIERLQGRGDADCYWHNDEWLDAWRKWIDYQGSVDRYVKSKEFLMLIQEFKKP
jgi:hypothetical protein